MKKNLAKVSAVALLLGFLLIAIAIAAKVITGSGEGSLIFKITGLHNGDLLQMGFALFIVSLLPYEAILSRTIDHIGINSVADRVQPKFFLTLNYLVFVIIAILLFKKREPLLFAGVDGDYMLSIFNQQSIWMDGLTYFGSNFLQSLGGNIWFQLNTIIEPGYIAARIAGTLGIALAHTVWALLLFTSTMILCRAVRLSWRISIIAAWLVPLLIFYPFRYGTGFYFVTTLIPHLATVIAISNFLLALLLWNQQGPKYAMFRSGLLFGIAVYLLMVNPTFLILMLPFLGLTVLFKIILLPTANARLKELAVLTIPLLALYVSGAIHFLAGLVLNTGVYMFPAEFDSGRGDVVYISTLFFGNGKLYLFLVLVGFLAILRQRQKSFELNILILSSTVLVLIIFAAGVCTLFSDAWHGPSPVYFEFFIWPVYGIYLAFLISISYKTLQKKISDKMEMIGGIKTNKFLTHSTYSIFVFFLGILFLIPSQVSNKWPFPPPNRAIMESLQSVSYKPGEPFRGRVATFTGLRLDGSINWGDLQELDYTFLRLFNNDFRKAGFWLNNIPTLTEYSPTISPRFYFMTTRLFGKTGDRQIRNMMTFRNVDLKNLKLLGVSYIISDTPIDDLVESASEKVGNIIISSYQLDNVNLGNWSPTDVIVNENPFETVEILKTEDFDARRMVVLDRTIGVGLSAAYNSNFTVNRNEYRISAESKSHSLLVLPIEYSSCFDIEANSTSLFKPRVLVANQLLTAVLFERNIDLRLRYRNGPFVNSNCRLNDYYIFQSLISRYQ